MENKLISANNLITAIRDDPYIHGRAYARVRDHIEEAPAVDAVEVVHGHWYKAPHHPYRCSNCGEMALLDMYGESHYRSNYCPNCGAKMDGGNEDV